MLLHADGAIRHLARRVTKRVGPLDRLVVRSRWASLRRTAPISKWGFDRGMPVDRWYIERFLTAHRADVHGHVLEVAEDRYATRFGAASVDVVDINAANPRATIVGDLCEPSTLPTSAFDAVILTQTLQYLPHPRLAFEHLLAALRPGATLLVTAPTMSRVDEDLDRWRWTPTGLRETVAGLDCTADVAGAGNALACRAFLMGLAAQDLDPATLAVDDPAFPLTVTARLRTPES